MMDEQKQPRRILHVLGMMERGGAETWLMHILRMIDRDRYQMDFLVHITEPQDYDDEIRALGSNIIFCPHTRQPFQYARDFLRVLKEHGPYDVVHSHVHQYSGLVLRLAKRAGVPVRIAHSHLDASASEAQASPQRKAYVKLMRHWIDACATDGLAASRQAAADLFGSNWEADSRYRTLFCGVDFSPFAQSPCPAEVRAEFHIPADAFVIGHVGRFTDQKNHAFLLDVARVVVERDPGVRFLLVGEGELRPEIMACADRMGLGEHIIFAGSRADVPRLMRGAMDVFVFPSHYEGLGLVLVEAQAARLPCVFSDVVPCEADIVPPLVHRLSLAAAPAAWADAVLAARDTPPPLSQPETLVIAQATPFDVRASWDALAYVYARHNTDRTPSGSLLRRCRHSLTVSKRASDGEGLGVRP
ncbi:MAG: glycosyltransferase [Chloroflexota bacterium]|nr:glycosyltransferase [Chloroflexota bacterium]